MLVLAMAIPRVTEKLCHLCNGGGQKQQRTISEDVLNTHHLECTSISDKRSSICTTCAGSMQANRTNGVGQDDL
jgi:hypothetical protein